MGILTRFKSLGRRDKILITITIVAVIFFAVYQFLYLPLAEKRKRLIFQEERLLKEYDSFKKLSSEYEAYREKYDYLKSKILKKRGVSVLTYVEDISRKTGVRENIDYIRPGDIKRGDGLIKRYVEIKIDAVSVGDLMKFLNGIEENRVGLLVSSMRIKPYFKDRSKVDVIVRIYDLDIEE